MFSPGDVANHKGAYSYRMAKVAGPAGRVYGFEPQRHLTDALRHMVRALKIIVIEIHRLGIASRPGERRTHTCRYR